MTVACALLIGTSASNAMAQSAGVRDAPVAARQSNARKAVLITGASTGIGRNMAETLASKGYFVYAGARKQADIDELSAIENIEGIRLDVTKQKEIDAAVGLVRERGRGLYGLVNNAGVEILAPLIEADEEDMRFLMDVNIFGPYRVTRAFAPLIIESKGRIVTTGSISGILSGTLFGPYSMSKHAVEAFTDSLASEMKKFDVAVSVIEPGKYKSEIGTTLRQRMQQRSQTTEESLYKDEMDQIVSRVGERVDLDEPEAVSAALLRALTDASPQRRYMVVPHQNQAEVTIRKAIEETVQLNQNQRYSYDRGAPVKMLDEALAAEPE